MIVDDDDSVRSLLRMTLRRDEFEIVEACDGQEAIAELERAAPDLVLLDWTMPGVTGDEVLAELKERFPTLPVIMLTPEAKPSYRELAESLGPDAFLTKPFSPL